MSKYKLGVIGCGFVGSAVAEGFGKICSINKFDIDKKKATHSLEETINCDFVFVCLPTPMVDAEGGKANLRIIYDFFDTVKEHHNTTRNKETIFIIKSTLPVGTTKKIRKDFGIDKIVHSPEFLTARNAFNDFMNPSRIIVGSHDRNMANKVANLYNSLFPKTLVFICTTDESEFVKYVANCFLATKVAFFNEMKLFSDKKELDWNLVMTEVMADTRIGRTHWQVPGPDGDAGFGGTCVLPHAQVARMTIKDYNSSLNSIFNLLEKHVLLSQTAIENLKKEFVKKRNNEKIFLQSCNHSLEHLEWKEILDVKKRNIDEEIYHFDTDNGTFSCTGDHLIPVLRNGKKYIVSAKSIKETDLLFSK